MLGEGRPARRRHHHLERPKVITRASASDRGIADGPGAAGGSEKGDLYGRIAVSFTVLAWLLHLGGVVFRAASVRRAPWGNMYEFSTTFGMVAVGAYLLLLALKKNVRWIGLFLTTTVLLDLGLALSVLYTSSDQLVPALHSYWLWIHVSCAIISGAVFYLAAVGTLLYLVRDRYEVALTAGTPQNAALGGRHAAAARRRHPGQVRVPDERAGLPAVDVHHHRGRDLGAGRLGPLLGAGTPRRPGRSSPGSPTPATCTPGRPPAGRAARPRTWR